MYYRRYSFNNDEKNTDNKGDSLSRSFGVRGMTYLRKVTSPCRNEARLHLLFDINYRKPKEIERACMWGELEKKQPVLKTREALICFSKRLAFLGRMGNPNSSVYREL